MTEPTAAQLREQLQELSPDRRRQLAARLRVEKEVRRTAWLCTVPDCSGNPHPTCPVRHARANQRLPFKRGDKKTGALWMAGRGFGKTRIGAEGVRHMVGKKRGGAGRIGMIARTAADVRDVMIEGESGLLNVFPKWDRPEYQPSKRRVVFSNGAVAFAYSSEDPDLLRGPQHDFIWGDEFSTWRYLSPVLSNALMGMRLGDEPRIILTGTPRPSKAVRKLLEGGYGDFYVIRGTTYENLSNLAPVFQDTVIRQYEGTRTGRQELNGELLNDVPGALLEYEVFEREGFRFDGPLPDDVSTIIVAIDPAVTSGTKSDHTGVAVIASNATRTKGYVMHAISLKASPAAAMEYATQCYDKYMANYMVAEVNNGGDYVGTVLRQTRQDIKLRTVHASVGKIARAEPVAMLYEQSRIHHVGPPAGFASLEDQWCSWLPKGTKDEEGNEIGSDESPDILDAVTWGVTDLMLKRGRTVGTSKNVRG